MYVKIINNKQVFFTSGSIITETGVIINPTEEQLIENGWSLYIEPEPTAEELLNNAKAEKITQIETYDSSENVEQFIINGTPMWLGHELRQQIRTSADAYSAMGYDDMTKVFNGINFTFPIAVWTQMLNALEIYAAEALNTTERHKATISTMTNVQDVIDYDYTQGYPVKLKFGE